MIDKTLAYYGGFQAFTVSYMSTYAVKSFQVFAYIRSLKLKNYVQNDAFPRDVTQRLRNIK